MFYYKQETNYEAPKWMEGEYTLKVHGCKITIERLSHDDDVPAKSHATCHKDDQFDIGEGTKVALDRLKEKKEGSKFKIGDEVEIVNAGDSYQSLCSVDPKFATRYRYGCVPYNKDRGMIVGWCDNGNRIAYVEICNGQYLGNPEYTNVPCDDGVYAMGISALKKV
jgi:hypothetical protein